MKVEDYLALRDGVPRRGARRCQRRLRAGAGAARAQEEIEGVRESTRIAEACFDRLLEVVRTRRRRARARRGDVRALLRARRRGPALPEHVPRVAAATARSTGGSASRSTACSSPATLLVFSFELVGRLGYWMELARMVVLGEPDELQVRMNAAVAAGLEAAAAAMRPGSRPDEVQRAIIDAVAAHGADSSYWSGHGIGQDVIEEPWLGLEVVQDRDVPSAWTLEEGMVLVEPSRTWSTATGGASATWPTRTSSARGRRGALRTGRSTSTWSGERRRRTRFSPPSCSAACTRSRRRWRPC